MCDNSGGEKARGRDAKDARNALRGQEKGKEVQRARVTTGGGGRTWCLWMGEEAQRACVTRRGGRGRGAKGRCDTWERKEGHRACVMPRSGGAKGACDNLRKRIGA